MSMSTRALGELAVIGVLVATGLAVAGGTPSARRCTWAIRLYGTAVALQMIVIGAYLATAETAVLHGLLVFLILLFGTAVLLKLTLEARAAERQAEQVLADAKRAAETPGGFQQ